MTVPDLDIWLDELPDAPAQNVTAPEDVVAARLERVRLHIARHLLATRPGELLPGLAGPPLAALIGAAPPSPAVAVEQARLAGQLALTVPRSAGELRLVDALGLAEVELDALWVLAAAELSPRALTLIDGVLGFRTDGAVPASFVRHVAAGEDVVLHVLGGALERHGLVADAGRGTVRIAPRALALLAGGPVVGTFEGMTLVGGAAPPAIRSLGHAAALAGEHRRRAVVVGPAGCGVRALAQTLAAGEPLFEVDLEVIVRTGASAVGGVIREVQLAGASLLLRSVDALRELANARRAALADALATAPGAIVIDGGRELTAPTWWFAAALGARRIALAPPPPAERWSVWSGALRTAGASGPQGDALAGTLAAIAVGVDHIVDAVALVAASGPVTREALVNALEVLAGPRDAAPLRLGLAAAVRPTG